MEDTQYTPPRLILHLEGANIDDLRAAAILALDLKVKSYTAAAAAVAELKAEPVFQETTDAAEAAHPDAVPNVAQAAEQQAEQPKKRGRKPKAEKSITEIAGTIGAKAEPEAKPLNLDAVRGAFDTYVKTFGVQAAQIDGPVLLSRVFGAGIQRIKDIPEDDTGKLGRIIAAVEGAILTNEFNRPTIGTMVQ